MGSGVRRQDAGTVFTLGKSSPIRNRLDQCLLGLEESQNRVFIEGVFRLKALILKALRVSYAASQALIPQSAFLPLVPGFNAFKFVSRKRVKNIIGFVQISDAVLNDEVHQSEQCDD